MYEVGIWMSDGERPHIVCWRALITACLTVTYYALCRELLIRLEPMLLCFYLTNQLRFPCPLVSTIERATNRFISHLPSAISDGFKMSNISSPDTIWDRNSLHCSSEAQSSDLNCDMAIQAHPSNSNKRDPSRHHAYVHRHNISCARAKSIYIMVVLVLQISSYVPFILKSLLKE